MKVPFRNCESIIRLDLIPSLIRVSFNTRDIVQIKKTSTPPELKTVRYKTSFP